MFTRDIALFKKKLKANRASGVKDVDALEVARIEVVRNGRG
jgi:hypothetical protein